MDLREASITEFTKQIASKQSVPGGGGASALVGAVGVALGDMVGEYTVGKKKFADVEEEMYGLMQKAQNLRIELLKCIDDDAKAFEPLSKAYSIPKEDPSRDRIMEDCLRNAADVPLKILELSCEAIDLQRQFADKGSKLMISDAATGVALLLGAIKGAAINVKVNTNLMLDKAYAAKLDEKVERLLNEYTKKADNIYDDVVENLK